MLEHFMSGIFRIAISVATLAICGCRQQSPPPKAPGPMAGAVAPTAAELAHFSRRSGIPIPASAQPMRFHGESGGPDSAMWLQFRLPAAELQRFIASSGIPSGKILPGSSEAGAALHDFDDWLPVPPGNFRYVEARIAPGRCVKGIFDFDDPETIVVYLMWFTT